MNVVILAAGYATRLRPLTDDLPKQLLPLAGRPMLDWLLERVREAPGVGAVQLVTNSKFAPMFADWAKPNGVVVHDDGTTSDADRLGAVGDLALVIDRAGIAHDELLVLAGDNLFDFSLAAFVRDARTAHPDATTVALSDCGSLELAKQYGIVETDPDGRIVSFTEKPESPRSTLAATLVYRLAPRHTPLVRTYLGEARSPDNAGSFIAWLANREPVYGLRVDGRWHDIGDREQLAAADNHLRRRVGLPERRAYSLAT